MFFALLVAFDTLAHFTEEDHRSRAKRFERIGLWFFGVAVFAEILAYPYSQRNDTLSEKVIVSLSNLAGTADTKARQALVSSSSAITQAHKAADESGQAKTSASNALAFARAARVEADSFEKDIVAAKKQATEAESHLAEALRRTAQAEVQLARIRQPRSLDLEQQQRIGNALLRFAGQNFAFLVFGDPESLGLLANIDAALKIAKWNRISAPSGLGGDIGYNTAGGNVSSVNDVGLKAYIAADDIAASGTIVRTLAAAISAEGVPCEPHSSEKISGSKPKLILISIGQKQL